MSQRTDAWNSAEQNSAEYMHWVFRRLSYLAEGKPIEQIQTLILLIIEDTKRWEHNADLIANIPLKELHLTEIRFAKGAVKAWRTYLIEREQQPARSTVPQDPPSATQGAPGKGALNFTTHKI